MVILVIVAPQLRKKRNLSPLNERDFIVSGFAFGSAIALFKVLFKVITDDKLQSDLDWDGTVALCISSFLGIYLSLKEIWKLFQPTDS